MELKNSLGFLGGLIRISRSLNSCSLKIAGAGSGHHF
jgi:hypothetical protein